MLASTHHLLGTGEYDLAIIGAGPVGLAIAIEATRHGLTTLVIDRRPSPFADTRVRPQLLVARAGDLANLEHLGIAIGDSWLVTRLATRVERDLVYNRTLRGDVHPSQLAAARTDLWSLAAQPPIALVPIGRLQQVLLAAAQTRGVTVLYEREVTQLRRHATAVSLRDATGASARAAIAVIATGAARSLVAADEIRAATRTQQLIAGVFAATGASGRWTRAEVPIAGLLHPARGTVLQTSHAAAAGTAVLVDAQLATATPELLAHCFERVAAAHGLAGSAYLAPPQVFPTAVTSVERRTLVGRGRAPIAIAGDAAQTGHVFSGQTCFMNVALGLVLGGELGRARKALHERRVHDETVSAALARYESQSRIGASLLARASARHLMTHPAGEWALAGVAKA